MTRRMTTRAAAMASVLLGGCSAYHPPRIRLVAVEAAERSDEATALHFRLDVTNENEEPIELREVEYQLVVDGVRVYDGRRAAGTTLHGGATTTLALPAVVPDRASGWTASDRPDRVSYRLTGGLLYVTPGELAEILLDTGVRRPTARFAERGRIDFTPSPGS